MIFDLPQDEPSIIKVIGVGGGGSNAVTHMFEQGIVGVDFAICNTDRQAMEKSTVPVKIQLGPHLTEGRGAGSKPQVGKQACIESIDDVRAFLTPATKMLFVTAGMGGGTGTGAAPIISKAAKEMDILTVGIITLPFSFEGGRRIEHAMLGMEELKACVDSIIVISNDKLREVFGNLGISEAFAQADDILSIAAKGIAEIITVPGYVNVDFEDVNTVMRDSGVAIMGTAFTEGENRARAAVSTALNTPLLEDNEIRGAKHILVNITSGAKEVTMDEVFEITEYIQGEAGYDTNLIWGNCNNPALGDKIGVTIIATGFDHENRVIVEKEPEKVMISLDEEITDHADENVFGIGLSKQGESQTIEFEPVIAKPESSINDLYKNDNLYTKDEIITKKRQLNLFNAKEGNKNANDMVNQEEPVNLNNHKSLADMENVPAYLRRQVQLDEVPDGNEVGMSNWSLSGEGEPELKTNNTFLHDNVD